MPSKKIKKIQIIINPASGKIEPILPVINTVMKEIGVEWDIAVTKQAGDGMKMAKEALKTNVDAIAVYGGDGSIFEVMRGMLDSDMPLVIFPGGTANVLATDLNIPKDLKEACELLKEGAYQFQKVDIGKLNNSHFILRASLGFETEMVKGADREAKSKFGNLAYFFSAMAALKKVKLATYTLTIDGKEEKVQGVTCIIANSGNTGYKDLSLDKHIDVSDGLLDVIIVKKANVRLFAHIMATVIRRERSDNVELVGHWQGQDIKIVSKPELRIQCDGEVLQKGPLHVSILPAAIQIIVPVPKKKE